MGLNGGHGGIRTLEGPIGPCLLSREVVSAAHPRVRTVRAFQLGCARGYSGGVCALQWPPAPFYPNNIAKAPKFPALPGIPAHLTRSGANRTPVIARSLAAGQKTP